MAESRRKPSWRDRAKRIAGPLVGLILLLGALWVLRHELGTHSLREVFSEISRLPPSRFGLALLATLLSYAALAAHDLIALKYQGVKMPVARGALAGFVAYAFANSLPLAMVTGGAVRARFYAGGRVSPKDTAALVVFNTVTYVLGLLTVAGLAFTLAPGAIPGLVRLPIHSTLPLGLIALVLLGLLLVWSIKGKPTIHVAKRDFSPTPPGVTLMRVGVSVLDWLFSAAALFVLFPGSEAIRFPGFVAVFMLGQIAGLVAQLPGGIGVFEAVVLRTVRLRLSVPAVLGALFAYRVIYFLLPLVAAAGILAVREVARAGKGSRRG